MTLSVVALLLVLPAALVWLRQRMFPLPQRAFRLVLGVAGVAGAILAGSVVGEVARAEARMARIEALQLLREVAGSPPEQVEPNARWRKGTWAGTGSGGFVRMGVDTLADGSVRATVVRRRWGVLRVTCTATQADAAGEPLVICRDGGR